MTISEAFTNLEEQCKLSLSCIRFVNKKEFLMLENAMIIRNMIIEQAFIKVFIEWELFLENSTIAYTLGECSTKGVSLKCYIFPKDEEHANQLIKGAALYPDWSNMEAVIELEKSLFEDGFPYVRALQGFSSKYKEMKKVRNHIAHQSIKSSEAFKSLIRGVLSASDVGITPAEFLL